MTFTDNDLDRIKLLLDNPRTENFPHEMIKGLVIRLEAAEECLEFSDLSGINDDLVNKWRKSRGEK